MSDRQWIILAHLGTLLGYVVAFGTFIVPLVIYLSKKDESDEVAMHAKASLNFQISMALYMIPAVLLAFILIGVPFVILLVVTNLICVIVATIKADQGELYQYPGAIRFIR
ncbi:MAG: DUF4870 domain-containing protein [Bacteroidota bacterium]